MDTTVRFYHGVLGMPIVSARRAMGMRWYMFSLGGDAVLAFFETSNGGASEYGASGAAEAGQPPPAVGHFDHFAFSVSSEEGLEVLRARLVEHRCEVSDLYTYPLFKSIFFADPNGLQLEAAWWTDAPEPIDPDIDVENRAARIDHEPVPALGELARTGQFAWLPSTKLTGDILLTAFADEDRDTVTGESAN
jgi:catechol 2,3-dioxygenase-like lactoylglutathione lyase family enzyme